MHVFLFMLLNLIPFFYLLSVCGCIVLLWLLSHHSYYMASHENQCFLVAKKNYLLDLKKNEGKKYTRGQVDFTGSTKSMVIYMLRAGKLQFKQTSADLWCQFQLNVNSRICQLGHKIYLFSEVVQILLMEPVSLRWEIMPRNKYSVFLFLLTSAQKLSAS